MTRYVRIAKGLNDKGRLVKPEAVADMTGSKEDYYASMYYYTDEHKKTFDTTGTIAGITDVVTDKLVLDFDCKQDQELARKDALVAVQRLRQYNVPENDIEIYFSGNKGFHVAVTLSRTLTPTQAQSLALNKFGQGLATLDRSLYNPSRVLRVPGTLHPTTKLYKIPLTLEQLTDAPMDTIKEVAKDLSNIEDTFEWHTVEPGEAFYELPKEEPKLVKPPLPEDFAEVMSKKPPNWRDYKWALFNGFFKDGERHNALMVLAATFRAMGYDKEATYYNCKAALYKSQERYGEGDTTKAELWKNVIEKAVFSDTWKGGQYAPEQDGTGTNRWLFDYCMEKGLTTKDQKESRIVSLDAALNSFENYAVNIDANTVKTGIKSLDDNIRFTVGSSYGIIGSPGSGKTSIALQMLNGLSHNNQRGVFFSYDMFHAHVMQKLVQRHLGLGERDIFKKFKNDPAAFKRQLKQVLHEEYKNVDFCFQSGQTVQDMVDTIKEAEQKSGQKVKLAAIDYNELVVTDFSDPTQSSAYTAQKIREIANVYEFCAVSLFQPNKMAGDPSDEIVSYRSAKGSSAIEQSAAAMLGISRPGFDPNSHENDWIMTVRCVKNRMGPLFSLDLGWDGLRGEVGDLNTEQQMEAVELKKKIQAAKAAKETSQW